MGNLLVLMIICKMGEKVFTCFYMFIDLIKILLKQKWKFSKIINIVI